MQSRRACSSTSIEIKAHRATGTESGSRLRWCTLAEFVSSRREATRRHEPPTSPPLPELVRRSSVSPPTALAVALLREPTPRRTYLHTAEWKRRRTLVSLSASSRRLAGGGGTVTRRRLGPRVDRRPTTRLHIRHQFYSLLTVSGHPCAGKLLNHPRIRTKAWLVTAPLSIRASLLSLFFILSEHGRDQETLLL